jgi:hypothetical protein
VLNTVVASCDCVSAGIIIAKSAGQTKKVCPAVTNLPFSSRGAGARFQDEVYGRQMRLHNIRRANKTGREVGRTCTVCGRASLN